MDDEIRKKLAPGTRINVIQQIATGDDSWNSRVAGSVVSFHQKPTGSWFAHSKDDKLWLDRLTLRKEDGELITLNLDEFTHLEFEPSPPSPPSPQPTAAAPAGDVK